MAEQHGSGDVPAGVADAFGRAVAAERRGRVPLRRRLRIGLARLRPTVVSAATFWGDEMDVVLPELVSCEIYRYGIIEPGLSRAFLDLVEPGAVVYDVGAHLGYYSLLAARLGADVHAFEPAPETLSLLRRNAGARVTIAPQGVWESAGSLELKDFGARHSAVNTFLFSKDETLSDPARTHTVEVTTIDDYVSDSGEVPDVIKIDAEGAELEVLRGARRTIERHRPIITIEVGDSGGPPQSRKVLDHAAALGYEPFDMSPEGRTPHILKETYDYGNVLLLPGA